MRAVRFHDYSGLDGVRLEEIPQPVAKRGEILVRNHAAGANPFDYYAVEGYVNAFVIFTLPVVVGRDFSGTVAAIGPGTSGFAVGDAVFGQAAADAEGTFAEYVAVPAARAAVKPTTLSHVGAASLPNVLMAAWDGLFSSSTGMELQSGQAILVNGAAGGIGSVAVQLARWFGARVIGSAPRANLDLVEHCGAEAHDYAAPGWPADIAPIDAVLDTADGSTAAALCARIRPGGTYVALRGFPTASFAGDWAARGVRCVVASGPNSIDAWPEMVAAVGQGAVKPVIGATYPLESFREALDRVRTGHARGKTVITIEG